MNHCAATRWPWAFLASLSLATSSLAITSVDKPFALAIRTEKLPGDLRRFLDLSELWGHGTGAILLSIAVWLVAPPLRRQLVPLASGCILASLLTNGVKLFVWRWRPGHFWANETLNASTWLEPQAWLNLEHITQSFPSGHSASAVALAYGMTQLVPRGAPIYWTLAIAACLQRISFNSHWPSDVLCGAAIGLAASATAFAIARYRDGDLPRLSGLACNERESPRSSDGDRSQPSHEGASRISRMAS